jgi:C-terminal processing protease CtpA/Prc
VQANLVFTAILILSFAVSTIAGEAETDKLDVPKENTLEQAQSPEAGKLHASNREPQLDIPDEKTKMPAENQKGSIEAEFLKAQISHPHLQGGVKHTSLFPKIGKQKMTAEDFRRLEYGVLGLQAYNKILVPTLPVVTEVFPTCPAANAGIRPGDVLVSEDGHNYRPGASQKEVWATLGGKAGTKVSLTIRRNGQLFTFHLKRMNIEDIEDKRIRRTFEDVLRHYGPPGSENETRRQAEPPLE